MTLTQSIELLENASARNFSSRKALIDACDNVARKILELTVNANYNLPRGYRRIRTSHWYAQQELHSQILAKCLKVNKDEYTDVYSEEWVAINDSACRYCGDNYDTAPRKILLLFAKDCAEGLLDEITKQLIDSAAQQELAVRQLEMAGK